MFKLKKVEKENIKIPKSVQDTIPVDIVYKDGIFKIGKDTYTKTFKFTDINYAVASKNDKEDIFLEYSELLNSFDENCKYKLSVINRNINKTDFEKNIKLKTNNDNLDKYRHEYNEILENKVINNRSTIQEKYLTVSTNKKDIEEARTFFKRLSGDLYNHFSNLNSKCEDLDLTERIRLLHDFYRIGEENIFHFDINDNIKKGHSFKDYICPDNLKLNDDYFEMNNKFGRVFFLKDYANYIKDDMVSELTDIDKNLVLSIDIVPVSKEKAIKEAENKRLGIETNIANWQRKQNNNNNFSAIIPYDMEQQRKEMKEFLDDLTSRDQRMFICVISLVIICNSKEELELQSDNILSIARQHTCQLSIAKYQQIDGLNTVLPIGLNKLFAKRTLTTESLAVFMPFRVQEVNHSNGIYYGENVISKNMIVIDRKKLLNGNSFILGVSGSGKSFTAKNEIVSIMLNDPNADILIIDPEREYGELVNELKGEVIHISSTSKNHINAMDINSEYADGDNPVTLKSEFMLSFCEQLLDGKTLGPIEKSIIDRCTSKVYRVYQQGNYQGVAPTLQDFREELLKQEEKEAKDLATAIEIYSNGTLNTFAKNTNVDIKKRLVCYDILDLGEQLMPIGMLVILDSILNRITNNRKKGRNTYIIIDEIYLLFKNEYSANFLFKLWKRVRKYGAYATGITQNVSDLLESNTAKTMLSNSEFIIMLNQATSDRIELAKLLNISETQINYITNVKQGEGLLKVGSFLIPFSNKFPKESELYKLMSTTPGEK